MLHTVTSITRLLAVHKQAPKSGGMEILITFSMICLCESLLTSEGFTCYNLHSPYSIQQLSNPIFIVCWGE